MLFDNVDMFNRASLSEPHASEVFHISVVVCSVYNASPHLTQSY